MWHFGWLGHIHHLAQARPTVYAEASREYFASERDLAELNVTTTVKMSMGSFYLGDMEAYQERLDARAARTLELGRSNSKDTGG